MRAGAGNELSPPSSEDKYTELSMYKRDVTGSAAKNQGTLKKGGSLRQLCTFVAQRRNSRLRSRRTTGCWQYSPCCT